MKTIRAVVRNNRVMLVCIACGQRIRTAGQDGGKVVRDYCGCPRAPR